MIVYKITNLINGKVYIGQTVRSLEERYRGHIQRANKGYMGKLYPAMRKYGIDNFKPEVIEEIDESLPDAKQLLNEREIYWIAKYDSANNGYNITLGGDLNRMDSPICRQHHKKRLSSKETRENISNGLKLYRKEHPFTEEHRRKLSLSAMGNHNFGSGDTRSIACYCIDENGFRHDFHSYKDGGIWWFNTYKPFGESYSQATFQRKIIDSINGKDIVYNNRGKKYFVTSLKWFKCD